MINSKNIVCAFANAKYWTEEKELKEAYERICSELSGLCLDSRLITSELEAEGLEGGDTLIAISMSGAVQPAMIIAASKFSSVIIYPSYIENNFSKDLCEKMLAYNAAPAVMDTYAVLKRDSKPLKFCLNKDELYSTLRVINAYSAVKNSKLLLIGEVEPWVISPTRNLEKYEKMLGLRFEKIGLDVMKAYYEGVSDSELQAFMDKRCDLEKKRVEPSEEDVVRASRFAVAFEKLLRDKGADGAAIACFKLLSELKTTACLALSHINTYTELFAACEGDVDSLVTMLLIKKLSGGNVWMANPNVLADGSVNFVHCTAPTCVGGVECETILRNHHESNIGVSPEVAFPEGLKITATRFSIEESALFVQLGVGYKGLNQISCRTQYRVELEDFSAYIKNSLGCHMVFAFEDIKKELTMLAELLKIKVL